MNQSITYDPKLIENKWYQYWLENEFFKSVPDEREPYTIVIPPPNVTGVLHMGHMLNNTIQDVLIRRARMKGKNACWVPGTDHASIATEAKVVAMLKEKGIEKKDLTRAEFLNFAYEWKNKYGGIILEQLKKLGASCDWSRTSFTMDPAMSEAVIDTFIHLYHKGLIYRGIRMVNWDPKGLTAVSDEEVIRKEVNQKLYYIKYKVVNSDEDLIIATTRPETIMADAAICVHPLDERYKHLKGKKVEIPLIKKQIDIIEDEYVSMEFGTGCLKVTPAHDLNDYELGIKHQLDVIDILNDDGTLNDKAIILIGEERFIARKKIAKLLEAENLLLKTEEYSSQIGFSERTDAAIEPKLSMQWFCKMGDMALPALEYVNNGDVKLIPDKFVNTYRHWIENVKDWCISRQLWWGQQIPVWYISNGKYVVCKDKSQAIYLFTQNFTDLPDGWQDTIRQDEDVVDTWFSSWLWPISVFDPSIFSDPNKNGNEDLNYYYPTNDLVTAPEILFFWVARMMMAGHEFKGKAPFKNVYLTGIVRDKLGRKMSKSLGNSPDPIDLIDKYGADGVRIGMLLCSPAGNDIMFDESSCEQGRNFANKIWNAFKLLKSIKPTSSDIFNTNNESAIKWFENRFEESLTEIEQYFAQYKLSEALMAVYKLVWDDFCSWYLEMIKPPYQNTLDAKTYESTVNFFEKILMLLHPFMPFITEELWHDDTIFNNREDLNCCIIAQMPDAGSFHDEILKDMEMVKLIVSEIRNFRNQKQISPKQTLELFIKVNSTINYNQYIHIIKKLANVENIEFVSENIIGATSILCGTDELFIPLIGNIDLEAEKERLIKEINYLKGFLKSVEAKLANEKFMANAKPEIIANEVKKKEDAISKLDLLEKNLEML